MGPPPYPPPGPPPYYQPGPYQPGPYPPPYMYPPPMMMMYNPIQAEAKKNADIGLIVGILGFFFFGFILGPIAIYFGTKARRLDPTKGMAGIVLGFIAFSIYVAYYGLMFFLLMSSPFF